MTALNPAKFVREVRQEMKRVTWPTRKETIVSTVTVLGVVVITSILFLVVDMFASSIIRMIIGV
ncbi:MAG: preprotein translocase subunit SecE [Rickettsiales bacterium]|jgi:preprotein translocase subunit SecE